MAAKTHGKQGTPIYSIWVAIHQRCTNPKNPAYKNYGARGIKVCERWKKFENFYEDVGDPPLGKSIDRWPDNDGDYELNNFRWATWSQQMKNTRPKSCGPCKQRWFYGHGPNGEMIIENNQHHVARVFELIRGNISHCLHGKHKTVQGWTFQWIEGCIK